MLKILCPIIMTAVLFGCSAAQQQKINAAIIKAEVTPAGALFCRIALAGGTAILANVVERQTASVTGTPGAIVALATNASKEEVNGTCSQAAAAAGGTAGAPVAPPVDLNTTVAQIALVALGSIPTSKNPR